MRTVGDDRPSEGKAVLPALVLGLIANLRRTTRAARVVLATRLHELVFVDQVLVLVEAENVSV